MKRSQVPSRKGFVPPFKKLKEEQEIDSKQLETKMDIGEKTNVTQTTTSKSSFQSPSMIKSKQNILSQTTVASVTKDDGDIRCFKVLYTQMSNKKHKTYTDGVLVMRSRSLQLKDIDGNDVGKTSQFKASQIEPEAKLTLAKQEVEVVEEIPSEDYLSGKLFINQGVVAKPVLTTSSSAASKKFKSHSVNSEVTTKKEPIAPRFSPTAPGALVLFHPSTPQDTNGNTWVPVVVDPFLANKLRLHQKEGVKFMYECVMGLRQDLKGTGCILADEMGLGKTLQSIALVWTLLKQGPYGLPVLSRKSKEKVIVIAPASLVMNWAKEFRLWLGDARIKPIAITDTTTAREQVTKFVESSTDVHPVLIISYEQLRSHVDTLVDGGIHCGLLICDEGHRIKNSNTQTTQAINSLKATRRILLSGTPIQNDLEEFYSMCNFVNPGILGEWATFRKTFVTPIATSREPSATPSEKEEGKSRSEYLSKLTGSFIIRRTQAILNDFLPPKTEQVLFCALSELQSQLYQSFLTSKMISSLMSNGGDALTCITLLKKLCCHPAMLFSGEKTEIDVTEKSIPKDFNPEAYQPAYSGKLTVLDSLLHKVRDDTRDRVVLVSNSTKTLDLFEKMCSSYQWDFLRLDGSTSAQERQKLVDKFNAPDSKYFLFLLSTRAGGVGLNLIGANRLILYDSDWNPANDRQAMARVWRDGQRKNVWIYRLLSTGTIEEKIFQRQVVKLGLSDTIMEGGGSESVSFTKEDLKDIFSYNDHTLCDTHDLLGCESCCSDEESKEIMKSFKNTNPGTAKNKDKKLRLANELSKWRHICILQNTEDPILQRLFPEDEDCPVTFVMSNEMTEAQV